MRMLIYKLHRLRSFQNRRSGKTIHVMAVTLEEGAEPPSPEHLTQLVDGLSFDAK
jgi:hypothetical protein